MRIRKVKSTKNEYIFAGGVWIRNFTKKEVKPADISTMFKSSDWNLVISNEISNATQGIMNISEEKLSFSKIIIVSDGYDFQRKQQVAAKVEDAFVIAVNGALRKWMLYDNKRILVKPINFFVVNNPYTECMYFMPKTYFPSCIMSTRTSTEFVSKYRGMKYLYTPSPDVNFGFGKCDARYTVDDYRSPICAAISLSYHLGARKIMLLCCDDSMSMEKPSAVKLNNGLWTYPHHLRSQQIIDGNLYWITREDVGIRVADYSAGAEYVNAEYISSDEEAVNFFRDE